MVVFGGTSENGLVHENMLVYNFADYEWMQVKFGTAFKDFFYQGAACSVVRKKDKVPGMRKVS